ncbi:MAG: YjfB family protein [Treponema sp.]|jgi:hypothetical protein|nr:YjfB family protein [Treponema sp.]
MDILSLSTALSQQRIQEEAAIRIQSMSLQNATAQGTGLLNLMDSVAVITDPNLGNNLDFFA